MKIIFLDIDDVLNSNATWDRQKNGMCPGWGSLAPKGGFREIMLGVDPVFVELLNKIIDATNAKVVVSSDWRFYFNQDALIEILEDAGFKGEVVGMTGVHLKTRGREIANWLNQNQESLGGIESFVILDDRNDMDDLLPFLVETKYGEGLQEEHVEQAINLLNKDDSGSFVKRFFQNGKNDEL